MALAIDNTAEALRRGWHPVGRSDDLGTEPTAVTLLGESWLLSRDGGTVVASCCDAALQPAGVVERYGLVWLAPEDPVTGIIEFPEWDLPGYTAVHFERVERGARADLYLPCAVRGPPPHRVSS